MADRPGCRFSELSLQAAAARDVPISATSYCSSRKLEAPIAAITVRTRKKHGDDARRADGECGRQARDCGRQSGPDGAQICSSSLCRILTYRSLVLSARYDAFAARAAATVLDVDAGSYEPLSMLWRIRRFEGAHLRSSEGRSAQFRRRGWRLDERQATCRIPSVSVCCAIPRRATTPKSRAKTFCQVSRHVLVSMNDLEDRRAARCGERAGASLAIYEGLGLPSSSSASMHCGAFGGLRIAGSFIAEIPTTLLRQDDSEGTNVGATLAAVAGYRFAARDPRAARERVKTLRRLPQLHFHDKFATLC